MVDRFGNQIPPPQKKAPSPPANPPSANTGGSGPGMGTYGEGRVSIIAQKLAELKQQLQSGGINTAQYLQSAAPLVTQASTITGQIAGQGGKAASAVNPIFQALQNQGFVKSESGQWQAGVPLSEQEYAALPDSAKATLDQIQQGTVPSTSLPGNIALNTTINQAQQKQQGLTSDALKSIRGSYDDYSKNALGNITNQLTTGPEGEQLRQFYNSMGLLNGGAFSEGLAGIVGQNQQSIMGEEQNFMNQIMGQNYQTLSDLSTGGLQRQFSLEDFYNNANLQTQLADLQNNTYMNALNQQKMNPWTQLGLGFAGGVGQGLGQSLGRGGH